MEMSRGPWKARQAAHEYSDSPLSDEIEDCMALLHDVQLQLGRVSGDVRIRYEPPRQRKRKAAPECDPEAA
jgi:hypothetical protein